MKVQCPHCNVVIETPLTTLGRKIRCGNCQGLTMVPIVRVAPTVVVHKYAILRKLRDSPFGTRFLAEHLQHHYKLIVTIFPEDVAKHPGFRNAFGAVAKRVSELEHPNLVNSAGLGQDEELSFCLSEYVEGNNLQDFLTDHGALDCRAALNLCRSIGLALQFLHQELGEFHGNVKPACIMVDEEGVAKLGSVATSIYSRRHAGDDVVATPYYVSPEALLGQPLDLRSDIYSLGCTLYHCLAGRPPFRGDDPHELAHRRLTEAPQPIEELAPATPERVQHVLQRMMARSIADRYQDYKSLLADLH